MVNIEGELTIKSEMASETMSRLVTVCRERSRHTASTTRALPKTASTGMMGNNADRACHHILELEVSIGPGL